MTTIAVYAPVKTVAILIDIKSKNKSDPSFDSEWSMLKLLCRDVWLNRTSLEHVIKYVYFCILALYEYVFGNFYPK